MKASHNAYMQKNSSSTLKVYRFRILAGVLFLICLISTWFIFYQGSQYTEELHINLQEQLKVVITEALLQNDPTVYNIQFQKMSTQNTNKQNQIKAYFQYSFDDKDGVNISVKGHALMKKKSVNAAKNYALWIVTDIQTQNTQLKFQKPITLFPGPFTKKSYDDDSVLQEEIEKYTGYNHEEQTEEQSDSIEPEDKPAKEPTMEENEEDGEIPSKPNDILNNTFDDTLDEPLEEPDTENTQTPAKEPAMEENKEKVEIPNKSDSTSEEEPMKKKPPSDTENDN